jgi:hypothetical protein
MERIARKFDTFAESEQADRHYYLGLTPQERLDILLELIARYRDTQDEAARRFARVYRIVERPRR